MLNFDDNWGNKLPNDRTNNSKLRELSMPLFNRDFPRCLFTPNICDNERETAALNQVINSKIKNPFTITQGKDHTCLATCLEIITCLKNPVLFKGIIQDLAKYGENTRILGFQLKRVSFSKDDWKNKDMVDHLFQYAVGQEINDYNAKKDSCTLYSKTEEKMRADVTRFLIAVTNCNQISEHSALNQLAKLGSPTRSEYLKILHDYKNELKSQSLNSNKKDPLLAFVRVTNKDCIVSQNYHACLIIGYDTTNDGFILYNPLKSQDDDQLVIDKDTGAAVKYSCETLTDNEYNQIIAKNKTIMFSPSCRIYATKQFNSKADNTKLETTPSFVVSFRNEKQFDINEINAARDKIEIAPFRMIDHKNNFYFIPAKFSHCIQYFWNT